MASPTTKPSDPMAELKSQWADFATESKATLAELREMRQGRPTFQSVQNQRPAQDTIVTLTKSATGYVREHDPFVKHFRSFGHFANEVKNARCSGTMTKSLDTYVKGMDSWRTKAAPTGLGETVAADGGVLVPPQFVNELLMRTYTNDLLSRCRNFPMTSNRLSIPAVNETSRVAGSRFGGIRAYRDPEAGTITASQPQFHQVTLAPEPLNILIRVTEDLLNDSGIALETFLNNVASMELEFTLGNEIIRGSGVNQFLGILNAPCLVTQAVESGQTLSDPIRHENIVKMWARLFWGSMANAVWLVNQDVLPHLYTMTLGGGVSRLPSFMPPGGLSESPYATLLGRPVLPIEFCSSAGTVGDIILADLGQYLTGTIGGVVSAVSMHIYFLTNEQAFRFRLRADGKPWWTSALTPANGTNTLAPFVALATRSA